MKTLIKIFLIFVIFFSIIVIKGCIFNPVGTKNCESCEITDFDISLVAYSTQEEIFENDTICYKELVIRMSANNHLDCIETTCFWDNFEIVKSAYADYYTQTFPGQIVSIEIYSNNDYDSLHPAGSSLNDIFYLYLDTKEKLNSYIFPLPIDSFLSFTIDKSTPPNSLNLHQFSIVYKEIDGTKIIKETQNIYITQN